jgi:predicted nucleic-acid-binding protein
MIKKLVDANVILRFLLKDDVLLYQKAVDVIEEAERGEYQLILESLTVGEIVWVLKTVYKLDRVSISSAVLELLREKYMVSDDKNRLLKSLEYFGKLNLAFADCWLLAGREKNKIGIVTFDKKLGRI